MEPKKRSKLRKAQERKANNKLWRQMWLFVAEAYATPFEDRTKLQRLATSNGLCKAVTIYRVCVLRCKYHPVLNLKGYYLFHRVYRAENVLAEYHECWFKVRGDKRGYYRADKLRSDFALFLAAITHLEYLKMIGRIGEQLI